MSTETSISSTAVIALPQTLPSLIAAAGERTAWRFAEFFTATIRNPNTREAYLRAVTHFFAWCEGRGLRDLHAIKPMLAAAYIEQLPSARPTVKQHLSAIRQCFDWLVSGGVLDHNPAASVRGPRHVVKKGKTPVLDTEQARAARCDRRQQHCGPARPGADRGHGLQLRPRQRRHWYAGGGLLS